ncbi:MAG: DUF4347 domain-containing protein, partial [Pseudanabaenaceae cyanobacterium]
MAFGIDGITNHFQSTNTLYIIDRGVANYQTIVQTLPSGAPVLYIDPDQNGISQITETLAKFNNLSGVHIFSHGDNGSVQLGNTFLNTNTIRTYSPLLESWARALDADADILFYGCNLAASSSGKELIDSIARLTGADVAASDDLTGNSVLGGNWVLEYQSGPIEAQPIEVLEYEDTLAVVMVLWESNFFPNGMTETTLVNLDGSGVDVYISITQDSGANLMIAQIADVELEAGQMEAVRIAIGPDSFGLGATLMVEYFVTGTMIPISVANQGVVVTDIDAANTNSTNQDFQDEVMVTANSNNPDVILFASVPQGLMTTGPNSVAADFSVGVSGAMGANENATFSFTSGTYTELTLFFDDGPDISVRSTPPNFPTNHVVGLLGPFEFDPP